ncbi:MAG: hypothetical protein ABSH28_05700 [Acidobacteriota bacterium]
MNISRLKCVGVTLFIMCFVLVGSIWAQQKAATQQKAAPQKVAKSEKGEAGEQGEEKLAMKDLPKAVQATVQKETQGAEIVGLSKETDAGKTVYEVETKIKGHSRDMLIDATGALTEVEEEIDIATLPAAVQAEIKKSIGTAKLVKLESVANGKKVPTGYSAVVENAGKQLEVEMGPDGKVAKGK